jgi:putative ABC transport system permease protein
MPVRLVLANLLSHPVRSLLTMASILVAVVLMLLLESVVTGLSAGVEASASNRLVVQSAVSLFVDLPESYQEKIAVVPGVGATCKWQWFGGVYQEPSNFFAQFGVDAEKLLDLYPEFRIVGGGADDFLASRDACLVGADLAERFGFSVGDTIPLIGTIFPRTDGGAWEFRVAAIYRSESANVDNGTMFFHYAYLAEALTIGAAAGPRGVGVFVLRLVPGARVEAVMRAVDELFENGPQRVQTTTEAEFSRQFVSMLGNIPTFVASIGGGVFFAILLAALNTMLMAARERTRAIGILKSMGFPDRTVFRVLLLESLLLCGLGGAAGVGLGMGLEPVLASAFSAFLPGFEIRTATAVAGLAVSLLVGVAAGVLPAWRASRLDPVEALRADS